MKSEGRISNSVYVQKMSFCWLLCIITAAVSFYSGSKWMNNRLTLDAEELKELANNLADENIKLNEKLLSIETNYQNAQLSIQNYEDNLDSALEEIGSFECNPIIKYKTIKGGDVCYRLELPEELRKLRNEASERY